MSKNSKQPIRSSLAETLDEEDKNDMPPGGPIAYENVLELKNRNLRSDILEDKQEIDT